MNRSNPFSTAIARKARVFQREGTLSVYFLDSTGQVEPCPKCTTLVSQGKICEEHIGNNNLLSWRAVRQLEIQTPPRQSSN
ncbi:ORF5b [Pheasant coronavirus]|nr:ORF5b [Pheasant coronavirus]